MNFISKFNSVISNPFLLTAYVRWVSTKIISGKPPRRQLPGKAKISIGEWLSFSEYWSFQELVPDSERLFAQRCLADRSKGRVAIDIGANVGLFTLLLASMGNSVHAFEPVPETFCRLKKNIEFNGLLNITHLNCLAVGKAQGLVTFQIQEDAPATNRMVSPDVSLQDNASTQVVAVVSLDDYCAEKKIENISFLKIDVEGMEPYVLQGAESLLKQRKISSVLIEICPVNLRSVGLSCADLYREFEAVHYSPYFLTDDGMPGAKVSLGEIETMNLANVVLLPDD